MGRFCKFLLLIFTVCAISFTGIAYADSSVNYVYVAGTPIGISVKTDGIIIPSEIFMHPPPGDRSADVRSARARRRGRR